MLHLAADRGFNRFRICFAWLRHTSTVAALSDPESMDATYLDIDEGYLLGRIPFCRLNLGE